MARRDLKEKRERLKEQAQHDRDNYEKGYGEKSFPLNLSGIEELTFYSNKEGLNRIHIITYEVATDRDPTTEKGFLSHSLVVYTHRGVGVNKQHTVICPQKTPVVGKDANRRCPICEEWQEEFEEVQNTQEVSTPKAVCRPYYWVIDEEDPERKIQLYQASWFHFEREMQSKLKSMEKRGDGNLTPWDLEEGNLVIFDGRKDPKSKYDYYQPENFEFKKRESLPWELLDEVSSLDELMIVHSYDELREMMSASDDDVPEEETGETLPPSDTIKRKLPKEESKQDTPGTDKPRKEEECPAGYKWGIDHGEKDDCQNDDICNQKSYEDCMEECSRIKTEEKRKKKEKEKKQEPKPRSRRRVS